MTTVAEHIPPQLVEQAKLIDVIVLAEHYTVLHRKSAHEFSGPCPKCGGHDRFHVKADAFFCRQCHPKWGDSIEFIRWMQPGLRFRDAVAQLTGKEWQVLPVVPRPLVHKKAGSQPQPAEWRCKVDARLRAAQACLFASEGEPGQAYLLNRGLEPRTWHQFGLGYCDAKVPSTEGKVKAPAICMPWFAGGQLVGLRYRFLTEQNNSKLAAEYGSQFRGQLFGGQALPAWAIGSSNREGKCVESLCALVICEGEINAMSIWQAAANTHLHVLSMGSESASLSDAMIAVAQRYGQVIVWADRPAVARRLAAALPGAVPIQSPAGKDANDLLCVGKLGAFLAGLREHECGDDLNKLEALLWTLHDAALGRPGVDTGTAAVIQRLAHRLEHSLAMVEAQPSSSHIHDKIVTATPEDDSRN